MSEEFTTLNVTESQGVARVTFDNPPINLFDPAMIADFRRLLDRFAASRDTRVVVFSSTHPDFFIGHADLNLFLDPVDEIPPKPTKLGALQTLFEDLRTLPQATIGVLEGRASGAGTEFLTSCDMVFAARGRALLSQFEVAVGVLPGATGSQRLPRLLGRSRALEMILGCDEFDAELAERYGLVNRALPAAELWPFVDRLAARIATFPAAAIALNKVAVDASELPIQLGLLEETHTLHQTLVGGEAQRRMRLLLELGAQEEEFEREQFTAALERLG
ncbi:enoyl-CoA hydratase/isomerase family protein [Streptomyces sp. NEAU-174]|uniref:enoyl-CoA hydratase/isomerase family protein n=1 Tax=Streptomyces sp. NEAU-174 TaxID=3458254 RepID=UPI004043B3A4